MTTVRVALLVWKPPTPAAPNDVSAGWPRVLQTRDDASPWQVPSVILRPGEQVMAAAGRVAYALGLELPNAHRVLAVEQRPAAIDFPEDLTLVVDGGWSVGHHVHGADGDASSCPCEPRHQCRWAHAHETDSTAVVTALSAAVMKAPAFVINQGAHRA
ncbi:hypothetical protein [Streptomyces zagrosensis]|uniref:Uncharacterized protein n=1 Tax=Streptomyces zagrosensis TaxID=1042984 RepID=A0A7W9UZX2_9ACTN|nr:hypothetical protein [Streptomyces zagrosensis]MBB5936194.1 hypothetical protein [Streptomyces zagrosensis]